jgi:hypothetical protein
MCKLAGLRGRQAGARAITRALRFVDELFARVRRAGAAGRITGWKRSVTRGQ